MDTAQFADALGAGLHVTVGGERGTYVAAGTTDSHVLLVRWNAPPGDGSTSDPEWIAADTVESFERWTPPGDEPVDAAPAPDYPLDAEHDPLVLTYPDPPTVDEPQQEGAQP